MNMPGMAAASGSSATVANITEFSLNWPVTNPSQDGSTHELVISDRFIFVTGQNMDMVAKFNYKGKLLTYYHMPAGSGPHGILLDNQNRLWVSLEFHGQVVRLDDNGAIVQTIDVQLYAKGAKTPINTAPHGIGLDADGQTIWFTGKRTSTTGKILPTICSVSNSRTSYAWGFVRGASGKEPIRHGARESLHEYPTAILARWGCYASARAI